MSPPSPDSIGPSPKFRQFTLSTGVDVDIVAEFGGPCRGMKLLSTASGDMTVTPAASGAADEPITVTNLPAGTPLEISATAIVGGLPNGLIVLVLCALAIVLAGCSTVRDGAVVTLNGGAAFGTDAEKALLAIDKGEQDAARERAHSLDEGKVELAKVQLRYRPAWAAYRAYRTAWLAAAAQVRVYDDAKRAGLPVVEADVVRAVADLVAAEQAFAKASAALKGGAS